MNFNKYWKTVKNTGKVGEICQSEKVGTMILNQGFLNTAFTGGSIGWLFVLCLGLYLQRIYHEAIFKIGKVNQI